MQDKFYPISIAQLLSIVLKELDSKSSVFGIPSKLFYKPNKNFATNQFNQDIDSPLGVAAGPHSQMAQNIIGAWLTGARYIELKTIQTLDKLEIPKPCIDMQDEGYNCEWSQELKIKESFNEYLNAWIIIHILNHKFGWNNEINTIFNMSVGYNLEGILKENVQWFFHKMIDCSSELNEKIGELSSHYPEVKNIDIPSQISNNITLSTMHGCPANEIEDIAKYLLEEKGLHTYVKLNPTLLGPEELRKILNKVSNFKTNVPDIAFEHDLKYPDALNIIKSLRATAKEKGLEFGLKLTNTLESVNNKSIFGSDVDMMYMSGRALHPISINVAKKLQNDFNGELNLSFSAGADAFNISDILNCGFKTVTVCSDILKPGGYMRLNQYFEEIENGNISDNPILFLNNYAEKVLESDKYQRKNIKDLDIKTNRKLGKFDCISAPCKDTCATNQDIPEYLYHAANKDYNSAFETILRTNPFPSITGMVCDHLCQNKCTRVNYDNSLLIREVKRFISEQKEASYAPNKGNDLKVAIIGAGPSGLSCAYYLALAGFKIDVFESNSKAGGMVQYAIPGFRLTDEAIQKDFKRVTDLGVNIHYNKKIETEDFNTLKTNYNYVFIGAGAQLSAPYNLEGINTNGILDSLKFLFNARKNESTGLGKNVAIIGGGNTAMDAARTAYRLIGKEGKVTIVYRRTINEMPADQGEIKAVLEEGMEIIELAGPEKIISENGSVRALVCSRMELKESDSSGRPKPVKIENSEFEIPCDSIIPAIGQSLDIDFINNDLLKAEIGNYETETENIFIGGDALRGAATAIKAIGDGRKAAEKIIQKADIDFGIKISKTKSHSKEELMLKRARREFAPNLKELDINDRKNFKLVSETLAEGVIVKESERCLQCDEICNICSTVCPNFANYAYETERVSYYLQKVVRDNQNELEIINEGLFEINQEHQILNIANFCNECGNCNTFCPTNSAPYLEKSKVWLTKESFDLNEHGYFLESENTIIYKKDNEVQSLTISNGSMEYKNQYGEVSLNKDFSIKSIGKLSASANELDTYKAVEMFIILKASKNLY